MIQFKQKEFWVGLAISAAGTAASMLQGHNANKINQQNAEDQLAEQRKMNRQMTNIESQKLELNKKLAKTANKDPMAAATALQSMQQKSYSNKAVKEGLGFIKNLGKTAKGSGIGGRIIGTAASGAVGVGAAYAVDKAIQRNAKKSGFDVAYEDTEEDKELRKKNRRKRALKIGIGATTLAGGVLAAKKGLLGTDIKNAAGAINKDNLKKTGYKIGNYAKEGIKDLVTTKDEKTGKRSISYLGTAITAAPIIAPIVRYASSKKQLKEQIKQSAGEEKEKEYSERKKETLENRIFLYLLRKNAKKKPAEKTYSLIFKKKSKPKRKRKEPIENKIFKTYLSLKAVGYSQTSAGNGTEDGLLRKTWKNLKTTAKSFRKRPVTTVLDLGSKSNHMGGLKGTNSFGRRLEEAGIKSGNQTSQKVGQFIKRNPKTALAGSIILGIGIGKAGQLGYKKTRKFIEDHDKNAFAYEKSQGMIVPKDLKDKEEDDDN